MGLGSCISLRAGWSSARNKPEQHAAGEAGTLEREQPLDPELGGNREDSKGCHSGVACCGEDGSCASLTSTPCHPSKGLEAFPVDRSFGTAPTTCQGSCDSSAAGSPTSF